MENLHVYWYKSTAVWKDVQTRVGDEEVFVESRGAHLSESGEDHRLGAVEVLAELRNELVDFSPRSVDGAPGFG